MSDDVKWRSFWGGSTSTSRMGIRVFFFHGWKSKHFVEMWNNINFMLDQIDLSETARARERESSITANLRREWFSTIFQYLNLRNRFQFEKKKKPEIAIHQRPPYRQYQISTQSNVASREGSYVSFMLNSSRRIHILVGFIFLLNSRTRSIHSRKNHIIVVNWKIHSLSNINLERFANIFYQHTYERDRYDVWNFNPISWQHKNEKISLVASIMMNWESYERFLKILRERSTSERVKQARIGNRIVRSSIPLRFSRMLFPGNAIKMKIINNNIKLESAHVCVIWDVWGFSISQSTVVDSSPSSTFSHFPMSKLEDCLLLEGNLIKSQLVIVCDSGEIFHEKSFDIIPFCLATLHHLIVEHVGSDDSHMMMTTLCRCEMKFHHTHELRWFLVTRRAKKCMIIHDKIHTREMMLGVLRHSCILYYFLLVFCCSCEKFQLIFI